jgi:methylglutaconyl-CoA hydratase
MTPGDATELVLYEASAGVARLTLNRPEKRNALNGALVAALKEALARADADEAVSVVALTGAGSDFCSGADLAELERIATLSEEENVEDARSLGALFAAMRALSKPIVAVVRGRALAGGCGLASACDLVLAHEDAEFGYPEVYLGFVPALVMTILRRKVGEGVAFELVVGGDRFDAEEARRIGLVNRIFDAAGFDEGIDGYLTSLAKKPTVAVALTKRLLYELDGLDFEEGLERGARVNAEARMTDECRAGVRRFLERSKG